MLFKATAARFLLVFNLTPPAPAKIIVRVSSRWCDYYTSMKQSLDWSNCLITFLHFPAILHYDWISNPFVLCFHPKKKKKEKGLRHHPSLPPNKSRPALALTFGTWYLTKQPNTELGPNLLRHKLLRVLKIQIQTSLWCQENKIVYAYILHQTNFHFFFAVFIYTEATKIYTQTVVYQTKAPRGITCDLLPLKNCFLNLKDFSDLCNDFAKWQNLELRPFNLMSEQTSSINSLSSHHPPNTPIMHSRP